VQQPESQCAFALLIGQTFTTQVFQKVACVYSKERISHNMKSCAVDT